MFSRFFLLGGGGTRALPAPPVSYAYDGVSLSIYCRFIPLVAFPIILPSLLSHNSDSLSCPTRVFVVELFRIRLFLAGHVNWNWIIVALQLDVKFDFQRVQGLSAEWSPLDFCSTLCIFNSLYRSVV